MKELQAVLSFATKQHKYLRYISGDMLLDKTAGVPLSAHPFNSDYHAPDFIGDLGCTDSIGPFLYRLLTDCQDTKIERFIFWAIPVFMDKAPIGNDIYAEYIDTQNLCVLCGGMTDYSGEGSAGYRDVKTVFNYLSNVYGIPIELLTPIIKDGWEDNIRRDISRNYLSEEA